MIRAGPVVCGEHAFSMTLFVPELLTPGVTIMSAETRELNSIAAQAALLEYTRPEFMNFSQFVEIEKKGHQDRYA